MKEVRVTVHGRVQGVGFRAATAKEARRLRVDGWVQNLPDGSVEVLARGDAAAVDALVTWLRRGPSYAHVRGIDLHENPIPSGDPGGGLRGFLIR